MGSEDYSRVETPDMITCQSRPEPRISFLSRSPEDQELYAVDVGDKVVLYTWVEPEDIDYLKTSMGLTTLKQWISRYEFSDKFLRGPEPVVWDAKTENADGFRLQRNECVFSKSLSNTGRTMHAEV